MEMGAVDKVYSNPLHSYTKMLMASVPRLDRKWEEVKGGEKLKEIPLGLPNGGIYGGSILKEVEPDHFVAC